jgi:lipid-binding SYLF domain-containing protein
VRLARRDPCGGGIDAVHPGRRAIAIRTARRRLLLPTPFRQHEEDFDMALTPISKTLLATSVALACVGADALAAAKAPDKTTSANARRDTKEANDAVDTVNKAVRVVHTMQGDPSIASVLKDAKGVYVIPDFGRGALVVGGRGGAGVLLVRHGGTWSNPAFFNMGGISVGAQAGAEGGPVAFILNNQKALDSFKQDNKFALNADAGLTVVDWSKKGIGSAGWGDITAWSNTKGLFGGAAISVTDVNYDEDKNAAYYDRRVAARDILGGTVTNPRAASLKQALASAGSGGSAAATGGNSTGSTASGSDKHPQKGNRD